MSNLAYNIPDYQHNQGVWGMSEQNEWITVAEAAAIMDVAVSNVRYLCLNERITCRKFGRVWQVLKADAESYRKSKRLPEWERDE